MKTKTANARLSSKDMKALQKDWLNCLPGSLSSLFYYSDAKKGIVRITKYRLQLSAKDQAALDKVSKKEVHAIRIYMGCDAKGQFAPVFRIVTTKNKGGDLYFRLTPVHEEKPSFGGQSLISGPIAELFRRKWRQLSDLEVQDAFSGPTVPQEPVPGGNLTNSELRMWRVKSFDFPPSDAQPIFAYLKAAGGAGPGSEVEVSMGAGLTVRVTHPFNFRPIIFVPGLEDDGDGSNYERSAPCPPYCSE